MASCSLRFLTNWGGKAVTRCVFPQTKDSESFAECWWGRPWTHISWMLKNQHVKGAQRDDGLSLPWQPQKLEWALGTGPEYVGALTQTSYPNLCSSAGSWSVFTAGSGKPEPGEVLRDSCWILSSCCFLSPRTVQSKVSFSGRWLVASLENHPNTRIYPHFKSTLLPKWTKGERHLN